MKKVAVLVISILFLGSIALIGVIGGAIVNPPDKVIIKVTEIDFDWDEMTKQPGITIEEVRPNELGEIVVIIKRHQIDSSVQIRFKILPDDASNKKLEMIIPSKPDSVMIDDDATSPTFGKMTFSQPLGESVRTRLILEQPMVLIKPKQSFYM